MDTRLEIIKSSIEKLGKKQHTEILKILKQNNNVKINENKSGVYINLSFLPNDTILELEEYIEYINDQEKTLEILETEKEKYKNTLEIESEEYKNTFFHILPFKPVNDPDGLNRPIN